MILRGVIAAFVLAAGPVAIPTRLEVRPEVRTVPVSVDATGATDVTTALNQFFAAVPDGDVIALRRGGSYRVEGTLRLTDRHDIELDGRGARIFATTEGTRDRSHLVVDKGSGIVIRDLVIKGAHPAGGANEPAWRTDKAFQHGILVMGARDVELDRVRVTDVFGDLVSIAHSADRTWSERIWVHDSFLARNGRQGIAVTAGRDIVIERNEIRDTRRATVDLEPNTPSFGAVNVHILNNTVGPGWLRFVAAHGNGPVDQVVIAGNQLHGRDLAVDVAAPAGARRSGFYVVGNDSDAIAGSTPLRFTRLDGVVVRDNFQLVKKVDPAISAMFVCGLQAEANTFGGASELVRAVGPACGVPPTGPVPPPPNLLGRTAASGSEGPPEPEAPGGSTTTSTTRAAPPSLESSGSGIDGEAAWGIGIAAAAAITLAVLWAGRLRRPGRRSR